MKTFKFLLPILSWALCFGGMVTESNHTRGFIVSEAMGLAAARRTSLVVILYLCCFIFFRDISGLWIKNRSLFCFHKS
ncbi:hypothetical protein [Chlamydia psittaci]|uniref:hypothetical protein n=1 Tax=Chlamydia psittaci TaxID=83554 RepID=UPI0018E08EE4|nr:hypothetical protein [Chlamydia psittaci]